MIDIWQFSSSHTAPTRSRKGNRKKTNSIDPDSARLDVPGDEHRILAAFEHPHRPVERRVVIRAPNRFLKGGGEVIVLVAFLEMKQG